MQTTEKIKQPYDKARVGRIIFCIFLFCAGIYLLLLFWTNQRIATVDVSGCDTQAAEHMKFDISKMAGKNGYMTIQGYAYEPGRSVDIANTQVLAYSAKKNIYYGLPTENVKREKLTKKAGDGFNYDYAGFTSVIRLKDLLNGCQIFIRYRCNGADILIPTDRVILY